MLFLAIFFLILDTELTDGMLFSLSRQLTDRDKVRRLGIGLKVNGNAIDSHLHNERDITEAGYKVLKKWRII